MRGHGFLILFGLVCGAVPCAAAPADTVPRPVAEDGWVRPAKLVVREGKGCVYRPLATFRRGDRLRVVGGERRWLKVDLGGRAGWVYQDALNARPIDPDTGAEIEPGARDGNAAAGDGLPVRLGPPFRVCRFGGTLLELSPADRGGWHAGSYQAARGLDPSGLRRVRAARLALTPPRLERFMADGGVGPPEGDWERSAAATREDPERRARTLHSPGG